MIYGLDIPHKGFAGQVAKASFDDGLIIELSGAEDQVLKILPPLIIEEETLREGLGIIEQAIDGLLVRREKMLHEDVA